MDGRPSGGRPTDCGRTNWYQGARPDRVELIISSRPVSSLTAGTALDAPLGVRSTSRVCPSLSAVAGRARIHCGGRARPNVSPSFGSEPISNYLLATWGGGAGRASRRTKSIRKPLVRRAWPSGGHLCETPLGGSSRQTVRWTGVLGTRRFTRDRSPSVRCVPPARCVRASATSAHN